MKQVEFVPFWLTEEVEIFTIRVVGRDQSETHEFISTYKKCDISYIAEDFARIFKTLQTIANEGALEYLFRPEGKFNDRVCALPLLITSRRKEYGTF